MGEGLGVHSTGVDSKKEEKVEKPSPESAKAFFDLLRPGAEDVAKSMLSRAEESGAELARALTQK